jgi:chromate reductase, NAD(P)H dehydrogenase (quinone)
VWRAEWGSWASSRRLASAVKVLAIPGSLRAASSNTALLEAAATLAPAGMEIAVFRGLGDLPLFNPDLDGEGHTPPPQVAALRAQVAAAGGVIISSPEYAHGVPGAMKNALDWLVSYPEFAGKPVVLWNASAAGGQWAQASLLETLRTMSARVLVEASLLDPFLMRKLRPGEELTDEGAVRAVKSSLAALLNR